MVWCIFVFVLVERIIGNIFIIKVIEVIKIGCKCKWLVFLIVDRVFILLFCSFLVNFIIRMVFLVVSLINIISFIWVKILLLLL